MLTFELCKIRLFKFPHQKFIASIYFFLSTPLKYGCCLNRAIKHENIAALLGCGLECSRCFLVTESLSEGSLIEYLHRNTMSLLLRPNDLLKISRDICKAMEYLEERRIVHNELVSTPMASETCNFDPPPAFTLQINYTISINHVS